VPLHFSRFHPQYKLTNLPPTPVETLERAREIALEEGMRFVYVGAVIEYHLDGGGCAYCGEPIPGVWWPAGQPVQVEPGPPDQ